MKKYILFLLIAVVTVPCVGQYLRYDTIPVVIAGDSLSLPWAGGFNSPQFSEIDLNDDGIKDLFVFERNYDGRVKTFINKGTANTVDYQYAPEYEEKFPLMRNWALLRDYNCDGKEDIFTSVPGGIAVYRNDFTPSDGLKFTKVTPSYIYTESSGSGTYNLYVSSQDIPAIVDVDEDGDLDVLTFGVIGSQVEYHRNYTMENYGTCDSLEYMLETECWGHFAENGLDNGVTLGVFCKKRTQGGGDGPIGPRHSGSTLLALDLDGDQDKELVLGDVSYSNMVMLTNGGDLTTANMTAYDSLFPSNSLPIDLDIFPAGYYLDVDNDGLKDLLVAPNSPNTSENFKSVWFYKNTGTASDTIFTFQKTNFLQDKMIEVGAGANPAFFDYNKDGLVDLVIGCDAYYDNGNHTGKMALFENKGTATHPIYELVTRDYAGISALATRGIHPAFGDLDDDGDDDMLVGDLDGFLQYYKDTASNGNPAAFALFEAQYSEIDVGQYSAPQIIDVNRDGKLDIIVGERSGTIKYFENTGTVTVPSFSSTPTNSTFGKIDIQIPCCTGYSSPFLFEDSIGNYLLAVGSESGKLYFYNNIDGNISGNFNLIDSIFSGSTRISVSGTDMNNNGKTELAIGEYSGGVSLYREDSEIKLFTEAKQLSPPVVTLYPNPSTGYVTIFFNGLDKSISDIELFDLFGKQISPAKFSATKTVSGKILIDISVLSKGIYIIRINSHITKRIVRM